VKLLSRILFASLIVVAVLAQVGRILRGGEQPPLANATIDAAARLGLVHADPALTFPLAFTAASCRDRILVDVLYLDGRSDEEPPTAHRIVRYVYLGLVRDTQDFAPMRTRWLLARALFVVGLRSTRPGMEIISVIIPDACTGLAGLDWAELSRW
jgi:hypothetical protein